MIVEIVYVTELGNSYVDKTIKLVKKCIRFKDEVWLSINPDLSPTPPKIV